MRHLQGFSKSFPRRFVVDSLVEKIEETVNHLHQDSFCHEKRFHVAFGRLKKMVRSFNVSMEFMEIRCFKANTPNFSCSLTL